MKPVLIATIASFALVGCSTMAGHGEGQHTAHTHQHKVDCGHTAVAHGDHVDYLHDGHLHHVHGDHVDEHVIKVTALNPDGHNPVDHDGHQSHTHGDGDTDHEMISHGDHMDYLHDGHLHHPHGDHVDEHGEVEVVSG